jgi:hypothetical protein
MPAFSVNVFDVGPNRSLLRKSLWRTGMADWVVVLIAAASGGGGALVLAQLRGMRTEKRRDDVIELLVDFSLTGSDEDREWADRALGRLLAEREIPPQAGAPSHKQLPPGPPKDPPLTDSDSTGEAAP